MAVRGKFRVHEITQVEWNRDARKIHLNAVCNDGTEENEKFHRFTPTGAITMTVDNPAAVSQFELGKEYYVDFTAVPPKTEN